MDHTSVSQLNMYLRCPAQYYYRYIEGLILPPNATITRGKTVHKGIEINYKQKMKTHENMPLNDLKDIVAEEFDREAEDTDFRNDDRGKTKDSAVTLAATYHTKIAANIQPVGVEQEINIPLAGTTLKGYIDLIDNAGYIRDTKTASKSPAKNTADKSIQLTAYALAYRRIYGQPEAGVILDYLVDGKVPKAATLASSRTGAQIKRFCSIAYYICNAIKAGCFYPNINSLMCSPKWCGYWDKCHKDFGGDM
ncbi:MAG: PD-(D/E)XK nuclease family protein [Clostridiales bacterium]|nr:PD-(D/E)XK nuclease family protein [Clostridiales bacterium]